MFGGYCDSWADSWMTSCGEILGSHVGATRYRQANVLPPKEFLSRILQLHLPEHDEIVRKGHVKGVTHSCQVFQRCTFPDLGKGGCGPVLR